MTKNTSDSTAAKNISPLQRTWHYLTKQQKIALGILSFLTLILPLTLVVIKTQTNIIPKASTPITPPVSPTPTPITAPVTPAPVPLSSYCQSCNSSLPPETPYSRCNPGLVCVYPPQNCLTTLDGQRICEQLVGQSGKCVSPGEEYGVCPTVTPSPSPIIINDADINNDGLVDISDYSLLASRFMQNGYIAPDMNADLNMDGVVDISDYSLLIRDISL